MSQQINLLNRDLEARRDWLAFPVIAAAAIAAIVLVGGAAVWLRMEREQLLTREAAVAGQLKAAQERLQVLAKSLGERKEDPALADESRRLVAAVQRRRDVLQALADGGLEKGGGFAEVMGGLSRQAMDGLWLTAFAVAGSDVEIRGRMLDPALLPDYIRRLNGESAFRGRRFDALEMKGVLPPPAATAAGGVPPGGEQLRLPKHTQFVLRASNAPQTVKSGGGQ